MELRELLDYMNDGNPIEGNSEVHRAMVKITQESMGIACTLNGSYHEPGEVNQLFFKLIGKPVDQSFSLFPPFFTDFGKNITVGKRVFINSGCRFQDQGSIVIGDDALIGHNVVLATLNHGLAPDKRKTLYPAPIIIGKNVWIGANATILQGVTIGDNAVVGAGSVVTKDIPPNTVAAGIPAKVIKSIENLHTNDDLEE